MILIFVAGASGSGKTTLTTMLVERLRQLGKTSQALSIDDYFVEIPEGIDIDYYRTHTNFAELKMIDVPLLECHLMALHNGETISKPVFDFTTNRRLNTEIIPPPEFLVIEGTFALAIAKTLSKEKDLTKLTVFVGKSSYMSILSSRIARDEKERNRERVDILREERKYLGPAFFDVMAKSKNGVNIDVLNDLQFDDTKPHPLACAVEEIISALEDKQALIHDCNTCMNR